MQENASFNYQERYHLNAPVHSLVASHNLSKYSAGYGSGAPSRSRSAGVRGETPESGLFVTLDSIILPAISHS